MQLSLGQLTKRLRRTIARSARADWIEMIRARGTTPAPNRERRREAMTPLKLLPPPEPAVIVDDGIPAEVIASPDHVDTRPIVMRPSARVAVPSFTDEEEAFFAAGDNLPED